MKLMEVLGERVNGVLQGLDRIRFRGTLRALSNAAGFGQFMGSAGVLLKDFGAFAEAHTKALRAACECRAQALGIPSLYLRSSKSDKEALARKIASERGVESGPICLFSTVEGCVAPTVRGNRPEQRLELVMEERKCVYLYYYFDDPRLGFGHVRLQTWLPHTVSVCLNGRHWLEKEMAARAMPFRKDGNCFPWVEDIAGAQALLDAQLETDWNGLLDGLLREMLPSIEETLAPVRPTYYWSADETEYATDLMFRSKADLDALFPVFARHAMLVADSPAMMRFLGHGDGSRKERKPVGLTSDRRRRYEGLRVKHWANQNSVKMYNKACSVLRIETTINQPRDYKVFRPADTRPQGEPSWQRMRKGVADLHRRCEVSARCNERYAEAIATCQTGERLLDAAKPVCRPARKEGARARALNPLAEADLKLLRFVGDGRHAINGFRNRDVAAALFGAAVPSDPVERKRRSGAATRRIRLLRAHGLVRKIPRENRYTVTEKGLKLATAILSASNVTVQQLMEMAA